MQSKDFANGNNPQMTTEKSAKDLAPKFNVIGGSQQSVDCVILIGTNDFKNKKGKVLS